ncbi:MAG: Hpt domain-containing protein [Oligoflexales bacterium]|nr:Hpt domain-containing protein [Oligoflexales bacterium]
MVQYNSFISRAKRLLKDNGAKLERSPESSDHDLDSIYLNIHTLKGDALSCNLSQISSVCHEYENVISQIRKNPDAYDIELLKKGQENVGNVLDRYMSVIQEKFGQFVNIDAVPVKRSDFDTILESLAGCGGTAESIKNIQGRMLAIFNKYLYKDIDTVFSEIKRTLPAVAEKMDKPVPKILLRGRNINLNSRGVEYVTNILKPMIINSIDHGILRAEERKKQGKVPEGTIFINVIFDESKSKYIIDYIDDGEGLDLEKLRELGVRCQLISDEKKQLKEVAELIFAMQVSTKDSVTLYSGRGLGMSALKSYVETNGGAINIVLPDGKEGIEGRIPFEIQIVIPADMIA